jgi:iron(III) transport system substrate-binding protein
MSSVTNPAERRIGYPTSYWLRGLEDTMPRPLRWLPALAGALTLALLLGCAPGTAAPPPAPAASQAPPPAPATTPRQPAIGSATALPAELQPIVEAARREGALNFVWGDGALGSNEGMSRLRRGFSQYYGLNLDVRFTPGPSFPEMAARLAQEVLTGRTASSDVFLGGVAHITTLMNENAVDAVDWASWASNVRDPRLLAPGGQVVIFQSNTAGITYNSQRVAGDEVPRSLDDLLKPQYKGRLASTPYAAHFDKLAVPEVWGEQRTLDYARKLAEQIAGLIRCNESERLLSGEFDVLVLDCDQSNALGMKARGLPIDFAMMPEAPFVQHRYAAIPRTAAHPNAARLWINYLLTREAQDVIYETTFADASFVPGSKTADILTRFQASGAKIVVLDVEFYQRNDEEELRRVLAQVQQILQKR